MAGKDDYDELDDLLNRDDTGAKAENKNTIKNRKKKERKKRNKKNNKNNGDQDKKINFDIFDDEFMEAMQKAMSKINTMNFSDDDEKDLELKSKAFMDETITSLQSKYSWYEECIYVRGRLANWIYKNPDSDMLEDRKKQLENLDVRIAIYEKDDYTDEKYGPQLKDLVLEMVKIPNFFRLEGEDALNEPPAPPRRAPASAGQHDQRGSSKYHVPDEIFDNADDPQFKEEISTFIGALMEQYNAEENLKKLHEEEDDDYTPPSDLSPAEEEALKEMMEDGCAQQ